MKKTTVQVQLDDATAEMLARRAYRFEMTPSEIVADLIRCDYVSNIPGGADPDTYTPASYYIEDVFRSEPNNAGELVETDRALQYDVEHAETDDIADALQTIWQPRLEKALAYWYENVTN